MTMSFFITDPHVPSHVILQWSTDLTRGPKRAKIILNCNRQT